MIPKCKKNKQKDSELENRIQALETALSNKANMKTIWNCDMNELVNEGTGLFVCMAQLQNAPLVESNMHYYAIQIVYTTSYAVQYIICLHTLSLKTVYIRRLIENQWEDWTEL